MRTNGARAPSQTFNYSFSQWIIISSKIIWSPLGSNLLLLHFSCNYFVEPNRLYLLNFIFQKTFILVLVIHINNCAYHNVTQLAALSLLLANGAMRSIIYCQFAGFVLSSNSIRCKKLFIYRYDLLSRYLFFLFRSNFLTPLVTNGIDVVESCARNWLSKGRREWGTSQLTPFNPCEFCLIRASLSIGDKMIFSKSFIDLLQFWKVKKYQSCWTG